MWTRLRRRVGVVLGVTLLLTGGGVAVASWTATGTGQGSARAASVTGLVVGAGSPVGALYPLPADTTPATGYGTGTVGPISATVTNPDPFPMTITSATVGSVTTSPPGGRTCAAGNVLPTTTAPIALTSTAVLGPGRPAPSRGGPWPRPPRPPGSCAAVRLLVTGERGRQPWTTPGARPP